MRSEPGRREGGGGGTRPLSERGLPPLLIGSMLVILAGLCFGGSSSTFGDNLPTSPLVIFISDTRWECRRVSGGVGGVFRRIEPPGEGGSGALPAASRSNTDSMSNSWKARSGAGGRGLLRSVGDLFMDGCEEPK